MSVNIARCPVHGLHGERSECFVCNGPVEQAPMVSIDVLRRLLAAVENTQGSTVMGDEAELRYGGDEYDELTAAVSAAGLVLEAPPMEQPPTAVLSPRDGLMQLGCPTCGAVTVQDQALAEEPLFCVHAGGRVVTERFAAADDTRMVPVLVIEGTVTGA